MNIKIEKAVVGYELDHDRLRKEMIEMLRDPEVRRHVEEAQSMSQLEFSGVFSPPEEVKDGQQG